MARRRKNRKKLGWFKGILLFGFTLFTIWSSAFLAWVFWGDIEGFFKSRLTAISPQETQEPSQEKILDEDRKKLEEILKREKP